MGTKRDCHCPRLSTLPHQPRTMHPPLSPPGNLALPCTAELLHLSALCISKDSVSNWQSKEEPMSQNPGGVPSHFIVVVPGYMGSKLRDRTTGEIVWLDVPALLRDPLHLKRSL